MNGTKEEAVVAEKRLPQLLDAALDATVGDLKGRAQKIGAALASSLPGASLYACLLQSGEQQELAVVDGTGNSLSEKAPEMFPLLTAYDEVKDFAYQLVDAPPAWAGPGLLMQVARISFRELHYGYLAVVDKEDSPSVPVSRLPLSAIQLVLRLAVEDARAGSPREDARTKWLTNVAEMTSVLTHEINNVLNGILLHVALIEQGSSEQLQVQVAPIRKLGNNAAQVVKRFQQYARGNRPPATPTDLNEVVQEVVSRHRKIGGKIQLDLQLAPRLPPVVSVPGELHRLVHLLIAQSCVTLADTGGTVLVRTELTDDRIVLSVDDDGPAFREELLSRLFEPFVLSRPSMEEPGLAVCKTLARRLQGSVRGANRPEGGITMVVEFPVDTTP